MPWACRLSPRLATTMAGSTWSSSAIPGRSRLCITSGRSSAALISTIRACFIAGSRKLVVTADDPIPVQIDGDPGGYVLPETTPRGIPVARRCWTASGSLGRVVAGSAIGWTSSHPLGAIDGDRSAASRSAHRDPLARTMRSESRLDQAGLLADVRSRISTSRRRIAKGGKDGSSQPGHGRPGPDRPESPAGPDRRAVRDGAGRHDRCGSRGAWSRSAATLGVPLIFKASFDKANRTSGSSFRGPGWSRG